jgi:hypothetical protein
MTEAEAALVKVVDAWEALPAGRHSSTVVERWLEEHLLPAVNAARVLLGREVSHGQ